MNQSKTIDWINEPHLLVGQRIEVLWKEGKRYWGRVSKYSAASQIFTVLYDDGEDKHYDLFDKTFRVEGETSEWTPALSRPLRDSKSQAVKTNFSTPSQASNSYGKTGYGAYGTNMYSNHHNVAPARYKPRDRGRFISKLPNATTKVTFFCLMDPRGLQENEQVYLNGSLDVLSAWEGGVPMRRTEDNQYLWFVVVQLPISLADRAVTAYTDGYISQAAGDGLFQYRYEIRLAPDNNENRNDAAAITPGGLSVLIEGQTERVEHILKLRYFHSFRQNHKFRRFKGWISSSKTVFQQYVQHILYCFQRGKIGTAEFLDNFEGIKSCVDDTRRSHMEELLEDALELSSSLFASSSPDELTLLGLFLAMIGSFGVTSSELAYAAAGAGSGYNSYSQAQNFSFGQAALPTKKMPPKPSVWCLEVVSRIDVAAFYELSWETVFGSAARWVASAVQEAIERMSEHNSYDWLRVYPLVKKLNINPRVVHASPTTKKLKIAQHEGFISAAMQVCEQITIQETTLASLSVMAEEVIEIRDDSCVSNEYKGQDVPPRMLRSIADAAQEATSCASDPLDVNAIDLSEMFLQADKAGGIVARKRVVQSLMTDWLHGVIVFAPSLSSLSAFLVLTMASHEASGDIAVQIPHACHSSLIASLATKISVADLDKNSISDELMSLLNAVPILRCPEVATAFLKNDDMDERSVTLCNIVALCVNDKPWWSQDPASLEHNDKTSALTGKWHALSAAAKEFILRKHSTEPEPPKESVQITGTASVTGNFWDLWNTTGTNQVEKRAKVLTDDEHRDQYRQCMAEAVEDVNLLITLIPLFATHYNGLLFELGRCWFLKGCHLHVLDALCVNAQAIGKEIQMMENTRFAEPVIHFINDRALRFIENICRGDVGKLPINTNRQLVNAAALKALRTVTDVLSAREELAHTLLFELVKSVSGRQLEEAPALSASALSATANFAATLASLAPASLISPANAHVLSQKSLPPLPVLHPALLSVLECSSMWERILMWYESSQRAIENSPLTRSLDSVRGTLVRASNSLSSLTLAMEHMQALLLHENQFFSLLHSFEVEMNPELRDIFNSSARQVRHFDVTLEQVQTYASFFCSCGVKVDAAEPRSLVDHLRRKYKKLQICELGDAINSQNAVALPFLPWLYELRGSELFLHFWRLVGREICVENIGGKRRGTDPNDEGNEDVDTATGLGLGALFNENPIVDGIDIAAGRRDEEEALQNIALEEEEALRNVERMADESEEDFAMRVGTLQQARANRLQVQFEVQDRRAQLLTSVEQVVLSQQEVVDQMLPRVQALWGKLAIDTFKGVILMTDLDSSFSAVLKGNDTSLRNDDQVLIHLQEELRLLAIGVDTVTRKEIIAAQNLALGSGMSTILNATIIQLRDYLFLRKLLKWIPCLIRVHELLETLFVTPLSEDPFRKQLIDTETKIQARLTTLTLREMSSLVSALQKIFKDYNTCGQIDFVSAMSLSPEMTNWLLIQSSTEEFNRLLQVVRPCTDEPRMLSAIASLVYVRTLLMQPLYSPLTGDDHKYSSFVDFLGAFQHLDLRATGGAGNLTAVGASQGNSNVDALWHLLNVVASFDGLMDVFEKQTRSPGIKSCFDLKEILDRGTFVLSASASANNIITLQLSSKDDSDSSTVEPFNHLLDLRSKLLMTEIPPELEEEMHAKVMVEAFVMQLQVLSELSDTLATLCTAGHVGYQEGAYQQHFRFILDGLPFMQQLLAKLQLEQQEWALEVNNMRKKYYYLNFFTMQEILRIRSLVLAQISKSHEVCWQSSVMESAENVDDEVKWAKVTETEVEKGCDAEDQPLTPSQGEGPDVIQNECIELMEQMGFSRDWALAALRRVGDNVEMAIDFCFSNTQVMDRYVAEDAASVALQRNGGGGGNYLNGSDAAEYVAQKALTLEPIMELHGLLHLVASSVDVLCAHQLVHVWQETDNLNSSDLSENESKSSVLSVLGYVLSQIFESSELSVNNRAVRRISLPCEGAANRIDMLVSVEESSPSAVLEGEKDREKKIPLFVACTESPLLVIDTVLSVYIRRGQLPEPGELMFCTADTTLEDLTLLLYRFVTAKTATCENSGGVFCIADLHNLSYTLQSALVEKIRNIVEEFGIKDASTLLLVSGLPRQVALNALSAHVVDLPPLDLKQLRVSLAESFRLHCGDTLCVASEINGGGKSHFIMEEVANRQHDGENLWYRKIPIREGTTHESLVQLLTEASINVSQSVSSLYEEGKRVAFHIDIAHIIPAAANTMLFQLLLVGVLRDPVKNRVYFRSSDDMFFLEVPNSIQNKTVKALRFCNLLPHTILETNAASLRFVRPVVQAYPTTSYPVSGSHIRLEEYIELRYVCQWLKGVRDGKTMHGSDTYDAAFSPWISSNVGNTVAELAAIRSEFFDILVHYCCKADSAAPLPSYSLFRNFVMFMNSQFGAVDKYALLSNDVLSHVDERLQNFKHVFLTLLIATSCDFSVRSVPQVLVESGGVGPSAGSLVLYEDSETNGLQQVDGDGVEPPTLDRGASGGSGLGVPSLVRRTSSEQRRVGLTQVQRNTIPGMVRQTSEEVANRFQHMLSWEQSEHPIVCFKMDMFGDVHGVDILSLNPTFVNRHISGQLRQVLEENHFNLNKDWSAMTNEEGVTILRQIAGMSPEERGGLAALEAGYVMTVDNLLKMLSIQLRLRFNLPVVIMGETGCGKSTLIRNMCAILGTPLHILNVHGGIEDGDIISWMNERIGIANRMTMNPSERLVLLLDEINTCNCMGLFKEIVCDRTLNGVPLPDKIQIIAACNPYRLRTTHNLYGGEEMAGLVFEQGGACGVGNLENVGTGIKDPLRNLVYRVHPLPESMIDHIYDFGALSSETESLYIKAMLRKYLEMYCTESLTNEEIPATSVGVGGGGYTYPQRTAVMSPLKEFVEVFAELVCAAQECIRQLHEGERSSASLRDVSRCMKVFIWFGEHLANTVGSEEGWTLEDFFSVKATSGSAHRNSQLTPKIQRAVRRAVILSLAYCYHARLPRKERKVLVNTLTNKWRSLQTYQYPGVAGRGGGGINYYNYFYNRPKCTWLNLDPHSFIQVLEETQREFVSVMNLGEGIALNEALCENLFMILCSILNQIPIFVIGKPGSSKSLAMGLVQSNLNGDASDHPFLKTLPAVEVFSYQCSPLSTSHGIEQAFESSRRYRREAENTVVVVLLDEVGLAEQSPHLPLKVLHKILDEAGGREAVVGISNWALDPAKMNRAVHLYRPAPTVADLSLTAEGMVRSANLKGYLHEIARAYNEIYHGQDHADFWGLREFYSTVKAINSAMGDKLEQSMQQRQQVQSEHGVVDDSTGGMGGVALDGHMLMTAILRNFGGRPLEMEKIMTCFFQRLGISLPTSVHAERGISAMTTGSLAANAVNTVSVGWRDVRIESLVRANLLEPIAARHLMLLTQNNAALSLLLDREILLQHETEVIFGSDFPLDQTDLQVCLNIQRVKLCMAEGITVVLVHCESLYESLYDLLNQHYVEYSGQIYVRLAFGSYTRLCPLHRNFRVIVIVEKEEAYTKLAPPLLNRFEKQVFERSHVLVDSQTQLLRKLTRFVVAFASLGSSAKTEVSGKPPRAGGESSGSTCSLVTLRAAFCGYHSDMLSSLILAVTADLERGVGVVSPSKSGEKKKLVAEVDLEAESDRFQDLVFKECVKRLLWVATPEVTCTLMLKQKALASISNEFLIDCPATEYFQHQCHSSIPAFSKRIIPLWQDALGAQLMLLSYSALTQDVACIVQSQGFDVTHIVLHELDQERELRRMVTNFFNSAQKGSLLLVQCDPIATSRRRIEHTKFLIELFRAKRMKEMVPVEVDRDISSQGKKETESDNYYVDGSEFKGERPAQPTDSPKLSSSDLSDPMLVENGKSTTAETIPEEESLLAAELNSLQQHLGIHVVLLIHLPRGDSSNVMTATSNNAHYCLDFDTRWRAAFVDCMSASNSGLPEAERLIHRPLLDLVSSKELNLKQLLTSVCRSSLAKLYTTFDRSNVDVKRQIHEITRCLEYEDFVEMCQETLEILLRQESEGGAVATLKGASATGNDITSKALNERELQLAGSFQGALHKQIMDTMAALFAVVLSHMDRNNSLTLYQPKPSAEIALMKNQVLIWQSLFSQSFNPNILLSHLKITTVRHDNSTAKSSSAVSIELKSDACGGNSTFSSRFPFSFYLLPLLETLRATASGDTQGNSEEQLQGQIRTLCLEHMTHLIESSNGDVDAEVEDASHVSVSVSVVNFVYDLTCMRCRAVTGISRHNQAEIVQRLLLCMSSPEKTTTFIPDLADEVPGDEEGKSEVSNSLPPPPPLTPKKSQIKMTQLSQVLFRFWAMERPLAIYFDLLDTLACHTMAEDVLEETISTILTKCQEYLLNVSALDHRQDGVPRHVHQGLLSVLLRHLDPCPADITSISAKDVDKSNSSCVFKPWGALLSSLHSPFFALLDLIDNRAEREALMVKFLHFEFYHTFFRDVAWPYALSARQVWNFLKKFESSSVESMILLPTTMGLQQLIAGIVDIGTELWAADGVPHDLLCPITLERMVDPVIAGDGHTYERAAIEEWISSGHTTSPFDTSNARDLISKQLETDVLLKIRLDQWMEGVDLTTFLEYYLLDVIFHPLYRSFLVCEFLTQVIQLLAGKVFPGFSSSEQNKSRQNVAASLLPRGNAIEGVLKELFLLQASCKLDGHKNMMILSDTIDSSLEEELVSAMREKQYLDTPISVAYVNVRQMSLSKLSSVSSSPIESFPVNENLLRRGVSQDSQIAGVRDFLDVVASMRCFMTVVADHLCNCMDNRGNEAACNMIRLNEMLSRLNDLLDDDITAEKDDGDLVTMIHSMRMYFLKLIAQARGISFLRQVLLTPPLNQAGWLRRWREGIGPAATISGVDSIGFTRFLGSNLLPRLNPFVALPHYLRVEAAVSQAMQSGDMSVLFQIFAISKESTSSSAAETECRIQQCRYLSGLFLLALFNEVTLLSLLPVEAVPSQIQSRARQIETWILQQTAAQSATVSPLALLTPMERHFMIFFGLGRFSVAASARSLTDAQDHLVLSSSSPPSALLRVRLMTQLVATALMCPPNHPGHFIHTLIFRPGAMLSTSSTVASSAGKDSIKEGSYLPTMPEDMMKMAQTVMGGRWYACPLGHPFFVDLCGRPTIILTCECGAKIGGVDHNLLADNKDLGNVGKGYYEKSVLEDSSERLYCVRPAADEKAQGLTLTAPRGLSPLSTRLIRLLMHLSMAAGVVLSATTEGLKGNNDEKASHSSPDEEVMNDHNSWSDELMHSLFNSSFAAPVHISLFPTFLNNHVEQDWGVLQTLSNLQEDEAALLLHGVLGSLIRGLGEGLGFKSNEAFSSPASPFCLATSLSPEITLPNRASHSSTGKEKSFAALSLSSDRDFWEMYVTKVHVSPWITPATEGTSLRDHVGNLTAAWSKDDSGEGTSKAGVSHFAVMLQERDSSPLMQPTLLLPALLADRRALLPTLWRLPRVFCFDEFVSSLNMLEATSCGKSSNENKKYPILTNFMNMFAADAAQLYALRFLPQILEWFNSLRRRYGGHITREDARSMSHLDCLRDVASSDPGGHWAGIFRGYSQAWNASWSNVQKFGCIQFSPDFKSVEMGPDVPLSFSLPNAMDEGNCPLALTHFLVEKQNTFAQLLDEHFLLQMRGSRHSGRGGAAVDSTSRRVGIVSSKFLTAAHTIRCDLHRDLIPLLEKHCLLLHQSASVSSTAGGGSNVGGSKYDFAKAERLLVERFLLDLPAVDLDMPGFTFKNEQHLQGGMAPLRQKLKQTPLSFETTQALLRDIKTPQQAQQILDLLETVVAFVTATGGSLITELSNEKLGQMKLGQYVSEVLMLPVEGGEGVVALSRVVQHQTRLTHLEALHHLLSQVTNCDIFAKVHEAYKKPLHSLSRRALEEDVLLNPAFTQPSSHLSSFIVTLKNFICESLQDKIMDSSKTLFEMMQYTEIDGVYLGDLEWFMGSGAPEARGFPQDRVLVEEAVAVYEMLQAGQHQ